MAEAGEDTEEYQKFLKEGSSNYDDSGFFSVQVISTALEVWNLAITPLRHPDAAHWRENPTWYNLNSLYSQPEYVSETFLGLLLAQLQNEGYSIFVVTGPIPQATDADTYATLHPIPTPADLPVGPSKPRATTFSGSGNRLGGDEEDDERELQKALAMSLGADVSSSSESLGSGSGWGRGESDATLAAALKASMEEGGVDDRSLREALRVSGEEEERRALEEAVRASL
ncbi:hypothetical protein HDV00_002776 [Rhizophlyctis rosea]|nr:hypothetical protein HDV00_002776 [Rhizophlyctis rosea]